MWVHVRGADERVQKEMRKTLHEEKQVLKDSAGAVQIKKHRVTGGLSGLEAHRGESRAEYVRVRCHGHAVRQTIPQRWSSKHEDIFG